MNKNKMKILKIGALVLVVAFGVGIFFTAREIMTKHQVVSIHKVIKKETGEEVTVFDDPALDDYLDEVIADMGVGEDELEDWLDAGEELPEEDEFIEDDLEIPDAAQTVTYNTENPVKGSPISHTDTSRDINISLSKVAYKDYMSTGGNSFSELTSDPAVAKGLDSVDWEFQKYYYYKLNGAYSRLLFNMDGMITDTYNGLDPIANGLVSNLSQNEDYMNYTGHGGKDGESYVYSFDNDQMHSFFRMLNTHHEQGTEVWLNTGWKVASRIQSWYGASSKHPEAAAPYDIKSFVVANIALLLECERRCPGTVKYITFGNEAANGQDFANDGDIVRYTRCLYTLMSKALDYYEELNGIKLCTGEDAQAAYAQRDQSYITFAGKLKEQGILNEYSIHHYYHMSDGWRTFDSVCERLGFARSKVSGGVFVNETSWLSYDDIDVSEFDNSYSGNWWDYTAPSFQVLLANAGGRGGNKWSYGLQYWPHSATLLEPSEGSQNFGSDLFGTGNTLPTSSQYYVVAMMQNYIPAHSDVVKVTWEGEDLRVATFKLSDGNYTILVEANKSSLEKRQLNFKFDSELNKILYRISYSETEEVLTDGLIPKADAEWTKKVKGSSFTDIIDESYCTYIYTTKKPVGQVKADNKSVTVKTNDNVKLQVTGVDGEVQNVEWEILASTGTSNVETYTQRKYNDDKIVQDGTCSAIYTPSASAQAGDRIAVKATALLSDGSETYTVILITIQ